MSEIYLVAKDFILGFSVILNLYIFYKLYKLRDIISDDTLIVFRQLKSMWGKDQANKRWLSRDKGKAYKSGQKKLTDKIKSMVPLGFLDDFTQEEMQEYILHPDTLNFFSKAGSLFGGAGELFGTLIKKIKDPKQRKQRDRSSDSVPKM